MEFDIDEIARLIGRQLGIKDVEADDHLQEDLGAESLDIQSIVAALEDRFGVMLEDEELFSIQTVRDLHSILSRKL